MSELKFYELKCNRCGGELEVQSGDIYKCKSCGKTYEKQLVEDAADKLRNVLDDQKQEQIANLRQLLWKETHEEFISNKEVERLCKDILKYVPDDFYANFYLATCSKSKSVLSSFLNEVNTEKYYDDISDILDYILKALKPEWAMATCNLIEKAYKDDDLKLYNKYRTWFDEENEKNDECVYKTNHPRDVFIAYSSKDMPAVEELVSAFDECELDCFVAARNLRHGSGAKDAYEKEIQKAIDHCSVVVFISSDNSRSVKCDAYEELSYIEQNHKSMPRIEYLIKNYSNRPPERFFKKFFKGHEYCTSAQDVADRVCEIIMGAETEEEIAISADDVKPVEPVKPAEPVKAVKPVVEKPVKPAETPVITHTEEPTEKPVIMHTEEPATTQNLSFSADQFKDGVKLCKKCGTAVKQSIKFCVNCGNNQFYNNYEEYRITTLKYCANCGRVNEENYRCCPECGSFKFVGYEEHIRLMKEAANKKLSSIGEYKDISGGYVTFGTYPQSKKADNVKIGEIFDKERSYYIGSDNSLYAKYKNAYYKVEPIKWKVLQSGSEKFVVADDILDAHRFAESSNNYADSEVRQFINSDFYSVAFNDSQKAKIATTTVDNSLSSTGDSSNKYTCSNTSDNVFLLSRREAEQYITGDEARKRVPTDYAVARGAGQYTDKDSKYRRNGKGCGWWWLRSPYSGSSYGAQGVGYVGSFSYNDVSITYRGVVPALKFKP